MMVVKEKAYRRLAHQFRVVISTIMHLFLCPRVVKKLQLWWILQLIAINTIKYCIMTINRCRQPLMNSLRQQPDQGHLGQQESAITKMNESGILVSGLNPN
ncbi:hypothetical protein H5410_031622 [Solanum commersonii]|uniref:Uncharacterized protein n=1 Tax=Solanum commersonii TaxID=4109 RepID=A0A9J5YM95_SOLCO|nr:hypothetical protein H5410_031622 [Solanum commersonii]